MDRLVIWLKDDRVKMLYTTISVILLMLSILTDIKPLGIDLAWGAILISGVPIVYGSFIRLIKFRDIKADLLVSIALIACVLVGEYFAAGEVVVIMMIGELLENYTVKKSKMGLKKLIDLKSTKARVIKGNNYEIVEAHEVQVGDKIRVIAGESIPVDGIIIEGNTSIDQSVITGESLPVDKTQGDDVYSATTNRHGTIVIEATKVGDNSSIANMINMIKEAEEKKAPILSVMDKWASYLVVIALVLSLLIGFVTKDIIRAITVLVVFCPCALVLATPTAIAAGIGNATKHGIIIKSGEALERLGTVVRVAFDKTGTLTIGEPFVKEIILSDNLSLKEEDFIQLVSSAEMHSEHPFGIAIKNKALDSISEMIESVNFEVVPGKGIKAVVDNKSIIAGNTVLMNTSGIIIDSSNQEILDYENEQGNTTVIVAIDGEVAGIITLADKLRSDSISIINEIHEFG